MRIPALRDPQATFESKAAYLNYMWSVRNPQMISTEYPIYIFGPILRGINRYTEKNTYRLIRLWKGAPFGPVTKTAAMGLAW